MTETSRDIPPYEHLPTGITNPDKPLRVKKTVKEIILTCFISTRSCRDIRENSTRPFLKTKFVCKFRFQSKRYLFSITSLPLLSVCCMLPSSVSYQLLISRSGHYVSLARFAYY